MAGAAGHSLAGRDCIVRPENNIKTCVSTYIGSGITAHTPSSARFPPSKSSPCVLRNAIFGAPACANAASCHPATYCCITGNIVGWNACWAPRGRFTSLDARSAREKRVSGRSPPCSLYISSLRARLSFLSPHRKQAASSRQPSCKSIFGRRSRSTSDHTATMKSLSLILNIIISALLLIPSAVGKVGNKENSPWGQGSV